MIWLNENGLHWHRIVKTLYTINILLFSVPLFSTHTLAQVFPAQPDFGKCILYAQFVHMNRVLICLFVAYFLLN